MNATSESCVPKRPASPQPVVASPSSLSRLRSRGRVGLSFVALALCAGAAHAELDREWISQIAAGASLGAGLQAMVVDEAGVSYVTGTGGSSGNTNVLTAAFGPDGTLLWSHEFDGPAGWHDQGRGITLAPGGVVYVVGNTPGVGNYADVLLLAYDAASGSLLNTVQYTSGPFLSEHGGEVVADSLGNAYVGGGTVGDGADVMVLKFDAAGNLQWRRTWDGPAFGPYSQDNVQGIALDPQGDLVVLIDGVMGSLHPDYVVIKYDPDDGSTIWESNWGVSGGDSPTEMEIDAVGDIYVTGTGIDLIDKFSTIKLRGSDGQLLWQAYDSAGARDRARALALDGQGGVYVTGSVDPDGDQSNFNDDFYTVKRDAATGAFRWKHRYGAPCRGCFDVPTDVLVDPAGHVFLAGGTSSPPYSSDTITFVLDAASGLETDRTVLPSDTSQAAGSGFLRFNTGYDLLNGGQRTDYDTGEVEITMVKFTTIASDVHRLHVSELETGTDAAFTVANATPSRLQFLGYSVSGTGSLFLPGLGITLGIDNPSLLAFGVADGAGTFTASIPVSPGLVGLEVWFQDIERGSTTPVIQRIVQ